MKVVLAYSGGLDTSVILALAPEEYGAEVVALHRRRRPGRGGGGGEGEGARHRRGRGLAPRT
jgi:tRNA U34 2-thiouridine synthase MnmA/TrmU